jgi:hypothetical protein
VREALSGLPLYFVADQVPPGSGIRFQAKGCGTTIYFTPDGLMFSLSAPSGSDTERDDESFLVQHAAFEPRAPTKRWNVKLDFVGAAEVSPVGEDPTPAVVSHFRGPRSEWKIGMRTYARLVYRDIWPGIDLAYTGDGSRLKYTFLVHAGADARRIKLAYRGIEGMRVDPDGQLAATTPAGVLRDARPFAYQEVDGRRVEVDSAYALAQDNPDGAYTYGFEVGSYDRTRTLVLDPAVELAYSGFIGGHTATCTRGGDVGLAIAVDSLGNAYVAGSTESVPPSFPASVGPDLDHNGGAVDAFVAKVRADGEGLVYAGYIGGSSVDNGTGIAVDAAGNAYVAGWTTSSEDDFPEVGGPDLSYGGQRDGFVAKVSADGMSLLYAGYIGGSGLDQANSVAVDAFGNAYVTGETHSDHLSFPVETGPDLEFNGLSIFTDAFVTKVSADGLEFLYSGYIGGAGGDRGRGIAVDSFGNAYVAGETLSSPATFPEVVGPFLTLLGPGDAFVAKVQADGSDLVYAGYIGGSGGDSAWDIAVDSSGNAYVAGTTTSSPATFPESGGPVQTYGGAGDAFVAKVKADGTGLEYAGYIGGDSADDAFSIAVDADGSAYVTGLTKSSSATFPVLDAPDLTFNDLPGGTIFGDAYVAKVRADGTGLEYCGYIGGSGRDLGFGIAVDAAGNAYVTGLTTSRDETFPRLVGPDLTRNDLPQDGATDAFVTKIGTAPVSCPPPHHFLCYEGKDRIGPAPLGAGDLVDQFGTYPAATITSSSAGAQLCTPADKNDEDPSAPLDPDHLLGHKLLTSAEVAPPEQVAVLNQFGTSRLRVLNPVRILVPAAKSLISEPPAPAPLCLDHFLCYRTTRARRTRLPELPTITVADQFGERTLSLRRQPKWLCLPTSKHGEDPEAPTHPWHLLCYQGRATFPHPGTLYVTDQFGSTVLTSGFKRVFTFCVPSLKSIVDTAVLEESSCSICRDGEPNGRLDRDEMCDDGNLEDCDACHNDCTLNTGCGDGHVCAPDECDPPMDFCSGEQSCDVDTCVCEPS